MPAPSVVVYKDAYTIGSTGTRVLTQRTVATGDVVAVVGQMENWLTNFVASMAKSAGTATIGTVTKAQEAGTGTLCANGLFTFTVTGGGTLTLTATLNTSNTDHSTFFTFVATGSGGVGNTAKTTTSTTTITASLTTSANSYVIALASDWSATGGATTTLTPAGGVTDAHETDGVNDQVAAGSFFSSRGGHWADSGAPATTSYGVNVPTSAKYNLVVCELLAGGAAASAAPLPYVGGQAYRRKKHVRQQVLPQPPPPPPVVLGTPGPSFPPGTVRGDPKRRRARARVGRLADVSAAGTAGLKPALPPLVVQHASSYWRKTRARASVGPGATGVGGGIAVVTSVPVSANAGLATGIGDAPESGMAQASLATAAGAAPQATAQGSWLATAAGAAPQATAQGSWLATAAGHAPESGQANAQIATAAGSAPASGLAQAQLATGAGTALKPSSPVTAANTAEGGTSGTTVTPGNSGGASGTPFDNIGLGTGTTLVFDNTRAAHGSLSYKVTIGSTAADANLIWSAAIGTQPTVWFRVYLYYTVNPTGASSPIFANSGGTHAGSIAINSTGLIYLRDSSFATPGIFTTPIPLNQWFRIEGYITGDAAAGAISCSRYDLMDSVTPAETKTATGINTLGALTLIRSGDSAFVANNGPWWLDDFAASSAGPLGPSGAAAYPVAGLATAAGGAPNATAQGSQSATAAGVAQQPAVSTIPNTNAPAQVATAAGDAPETGLAQAQNATATGAAQNATVAVTVAVNAGLATASGTAPPSGMAQAQVATGIGAAQQPTVQTSGSANAPAQVATGTGAAPPSGMAQAQPATGAGTVSPSGMAQAQPATAAGAAQQANGQGSWLATGIGAAQQTAGHNVTAAAATGAAPASSMAQAGLAAGTGAAPASGMALAQAATATGTAPQAEAQGSWPATAAGVAQQPTVQAVGNANAPAQIATGTGAAPPSGMAQAGLASATGTAQQPTVSTVSTTNAPAQVATGSGAAQQATAQGSWPATAAGAAQQTAGHNVTAATAAGDAPETGLAQAGLAAGTGAGQPATVLTGRNAVAGLAAASGFASQPGGHNTQLAAAVAAAIQPGVQGTAAVVKAHVITGVTGKTGAGTVSGKANGTTVTGPVRTAIYTATYGPVYTAQDEPSSVADPRDGTTKVTGKTPAAAVS